MMKKELHGKNCAYCEMSCDEEVLRLILTGSDVKQGMYPIRCFELVQQFPFPFHLRKQTG